MNSNWLREAPLKTPNDASETNQLFVPKETVNNPFDLTLVVSDSKDKSKFIDASSQRQVFSSKNC